jgi:hypothetical protein
MDGILMETPPDDIISMSGSNLLQITNLWDGWVEVEGGQW